MKKQIELHFLTTEDYTLRYNWLLENCQKDTDGKTIHPLSKCADTVENCMVPPSEYRQCLEGYDFALSSNIDESHVTYYINEILTHMENLQDSTFALRAEMEKGYIHN